jgi:hypothetical protein
MIPFISFHFVVLFFLFSPLFFFASGMHVWSVAGGFHGRIFRKCLLYIFTCFGAGNELAWGATGCKEGIDI